MGERDPDDRAPTPVDPSNARRVRSGVTIVVAAAVALSACGGGDERFGDELPPVRIASGSTTTSTAPTTTEAPTLGPTTTVTAAADTTTPPSVLVPATTAPPSTAAPTTEPPANQPAGTQPPSAPAAPATTATPTTTAAPIAGGSGNSPGAIGGAATVGGGAGRGGAAPADRISTPVLLAWIGGADVVNDEVSVPAAVATRVTTIDERPVELRPIVETDPDIDDVIDLIGDAVTDGADGLVVAISPTLAAWGGTDRCDGVVPEPAFIACLLDPPTGTDAAERTDALERLVDAIVAADTPTLVYISGVSAQAFADPSLGPDITTAENAIAVLDPTSTAIEFGSESITRDVTGADEGTAFLDAVTISDAGAELIADALAPAIDSFFSTQIN